MKISTPNYGRYAANRRSTAMTLVEVMVASAISLLLVGGAMTYLWWSGLGVAGVGAQALRTQQAGNALEFIQTRARLAVAVSNDAAGNTLTLAFDDNPAVDADHDGNPYNDRDHFERFAFIGLNSSTNCATNRLVYLSNINSTSQWALIPGGVRNLPGSGIFTVTNLYTTVIRFGVMDPYTRDHYQSIDIQATALPLNRRAATNFIAILP